jgi:hypothetical protein
MKLIKLTRLIFNGRVWEAGGPIWINPEHIMAIHEWKDHRAGAIHPTSTVFLVGGYEREILQRPEEVAQMAYEARPVIETIVLGE